MDKDNFLSFRFRKIETEEEYSKITELMEYILELPDADDNDYVTLLWGMCQDLVTEYEEKMELEDEEDVEDGPEGATVETSLVGSAEPEADPDKVAFRGKKKDS